MLNEEKHYKILNGDFHCKSVPCQ